MRLINKVIIFSIKRLSFSCRFSKKLFIPVLTVSKAFLRNLLLIIHQGAFVGAFASSNLGDVSPNIKGPICIDTGDECDFVTSTCNGSPEFCIASGPGENMVESTQIIASRLFNKAVVTISTCQNSASFLTTQL